MRNFDGRLRWWIAHRVNRIPGQCWAGLVGWVLREHHDDRGAGLAAALPWRPISATCREDAERAGRCYCGALSSDGTRLRDDEYGCVARVPGRNDRLCSKPSGHDGMHRCGGLEWGRL